MIRTLALAVGLLASLAAQAGGVVRIALRVAVALFVLAIPDLLYQRWQHKQDLKMTWHEYLDDLRRMEGDPLIRRRQRKQLGRKHPRAEVSPGA